MLAERADSLVGAMLGKDYRVLERIGSGGMAVVYLVEHQTLLKQFAAKVLSSELASSLEARARFTQEAHAASQLDHENIVSISDFGVTLDHRPFFVMELLRGQTLEQRLASGPMSLEEVVAVSVPVARALAHAHAEGIVHRDVKPENIFLVQRSQGRGGVKVVDFGIAKTPIHPKLTHTKPKLGETLGSPRFMSPEMCRGDDEEVDQRADIYSFGVLLYLMLCGRLPFDDDNLLRVLQMHLSEPLPPPREVNPALAPELAAILERALAKQPEDRYPSMDALLVDLEAALPSGSDRLLIEAQSGTALGETPFAGALAVARTSSQGTAQPPPSPSAVMPIAPRRSRAPIAFVAGVVIASAAGLVMWRKLATPSSAASGAASGAAAASPIVVTTDVAAPPAVEITPTPALPPPGGDDLITPAIRLRATTEADPPASPRPGRPVPAVKQGPPPRPVLPRDRRRPGQDVGAAAPVQVATAPAAAGAQAAPGSSATEVPAVAPPPAAPAVPATQPIAPPPDVAPIAAPPVPRPPPAPRDPGSLDAIPEVASLDVKGSLLPSVVRRSVERTLPALRGCYGAAARASQATPAIDLQLSFEIDENGLATRVTVAPVVLGSLARCASGVAGQIRTQVAPDIGTAQVAVVIRFRPS